MQKTTLLLFVYIFLWIPTTQAMFTRELSTKEQFTAIKTKINAYHHYSECMKNVSAGMLSTPFLVCMACAGLEKLNFLQNYNQALLECAKDSNYTFGLGLLAYTIAHLFYVCRWTDPTWIKQTDYRPELYVLRSPYAEVPCFKVELCELYKVQKLVNEAYECLCHYSLKHFSSCSRFFLSDHYLLKKIGIDTMQPKFPSLERIDTNIKNFFGEALMCHRLKNYQEMGTLTKWLPAELCCHIASYLSESPPKHVVLSRKELFCSIMPWLITYEIEYNVDKMRCRKGNSEWICLNGNMGKVIFGAKNLHYGIKDYYTAEKPFSRLGYHDGGRCSYCIRYGATGLYRNQNHRSYQAYFGNKCTRASIMIQLKIVDALHGVLLVILDGLICCACNVYLLTYPYTS